MLDNLSGTNEKAILERISAARRPKPQEPIGNQVAEKAEPAKVDAKLPEVQDLAQSDAVDNERSTAQDEEEFYVNYKGREISFKDIEKWENGHLMQSDYTKKTTNLSNERKEFEKERAEFRERMQKADESFALLQELMSEYDKQDFDGMTLEELKQYDPSQYLKVMDAKAKRENILNRFKTEKDSLSTKEREEKTKRTQSKLLELNPQWFKDNAPTDAYKQDMDLVQKYLVKLGYTPDDQAKIVSSRQWQAILDAARYSAIKDKSDATAKKVREAPLMTKPAGQASSSAQAEYEKALANHKRLGTIDTAMALRKAKSKL